VGIGPKVAFKIHIHPATPLDSSICKIVAPRWISRQKTELHLFSPPDNQLRVMEYLRMLNWRRMHSLASWDTTFFLVIPHVNGGPKIPLFWLATSNVWAYVWVLLLSSRKHGTKSPWSSRIVLHDLTVFSRNIYLICWTPLCSCISSKNTKKTRGI
jgi:hypothetical protein